jgi:DNA-binding transcriptional MerR regulator
MTIKQVEEILGINRETIRYYIHEGLVSPRQNDKGYRFYSDEDVKQLKRIMILRQLEVSVAGIRDILNGDLDFIPVLEQSKVILDKKSKYVDDAIRICAELAQSGDSNFDPDPLFTRHDANMH